MGVPLITVVVKYVCMLPLGAAPAAQVSLVVEELVIDVVRTVKEAVSDFIAS